jgi:hypothetical protein
MQGRGVMAVIHVKICYSKDDEQVPEQSHFRSLTVNISISILVHLQENSTSRPPSPFPLPPFWGQIRTCFELICARVVDVNRRQGFGVTIPGRAFRRSASRFSRPPANGPSSSLTDTTIFQSPVVIRVWHIITHSRWAFCHDTCVSRARGYVRAVPHYIRR